MPETLREASNRRLRHNAFVVVAAIADAIRPDPQERVSEWAANYRIVPDIGSVPGKWLNETAPYLVEPMDALSPDDPCERVVVLKPSQSGGSAIAENWLGFVMHRTPGPAMYVGPTVQAARDWHQEKLLPTIEATPVLAPARGGVVAPNRSRSGDGSTAQRIRFRGGFVLLAGANSAASLRQHSIRFMVRDDRSAWTDNADNEGDPKDLSEARLKTFRVFGLAKVLDVSSPRFKGADIDADYEQSDRRRYYLACKSCRSVSDLDWEDVRRSREPPYRCRLVCPACGTEHSEADKADMLAEASGACWIATAPDGDGVVPPKTIAPTDIAAWRSRETGRPVKGYAITGVMNVFDKWEMLAAAEDAAGDDPDKLQPFQNTSLGRAWEPKGEGPSWEVLKGRAEDWERGAVPPGPLYFTFTVDVKGDGLHWQRKGWGPNKQSWHLDYDWIAGETDAPLEGAWKQLDAIVDRGFTLGGSKLADDLIGVDSGYNADAVYAWVKRRHNALALKGVEGWNKLPIFRAENPEIRKHGLSAGKARRHGLKVWLVGTYGIKGALTIYLSRAAREGGAGFPTGYHHLPRNVTEEYLRHLTAEFIRIEEVHGEHRRVWEKRGPNHWLDCEVYGWALAAFAGLWAWDEAQWERRAAELTELTRRPQTDLFHREAPAVASPQPLSGDEEPPEDDPPAVPAGSRRHAAAAALDRLARLNQ